MLKPLFLLMIFFVTSCASFNSPFRGRTISSVSDPDFTYIEKDGHYYIKTTYHLAGPEHGNHEIRLPLDYVFSTHSKDKIFGLQNYSFILSGVDFECTDESPGINKGKLLDNQEYMIEDHGILSFEKVMCKNSNRSDYSKVEVTYKIKKNLLFSVDQIEEFAISQSLLSSENISDDFKKVFTYHLKYLSSPSLYADHKEMHQSIGEKENIKISSNTHGYQYKVKLEKDSGIMISPPTGMVDFHRVGKLGPIGTSEEKTRGSSLSSEHQPYALICKVTRVDGSEWIYDFSNHPSSRLAFKNKETIECGINQPKRSRRLRKNKGHFEFTTSILSVSSVRDEFEKSKQEPQSFLDSLVKESNKKNINAVENKQREVQKSYDEVIASETDISEIAPILRTVTTEVNSIEFVFKPYKEKIIHEGKALYFLDYDIYMDTSHYFPKVYNSYHKLEISADFIHIQESLKFKIKTNIKYDKELHNQIMSPLKFKVPYKDKQLYIEKLNKLSSQKFVKEENFKDIFEIDSSYNWLNKNTSQLKVRRTGILVCAKLGSYEKALPRGTVQKGEIIFHKVRSLYNQDDQRFKHIKLAFDKEIEESTFKTDLDYEKFEKSQQCFPINSQNLSKRNFEKFVKEFK
jgi:hypothetical protein